jgi:6-pyruvoyltetrahydropterin/6-carboxytetrahydropterin synthase
MNYILRKTYEFEAAHWLPEVPEGHKCGKVHGHSYRIVIELSSDELDKGMVVDYKDISQCIKGPIIHVLDHQTLNDFIENPTAENICLYIAKTFKHDFRMNFYRPTHPWFKGRDRRITLRAVEVSETLKTNCRVEFMETL